MNGSASTAPNVMYEDTFLVNSDVAAGYLSPLNSYLASWSGWKEFSPAAQAAAKGASGKIYGVSMGTDTRGLYYNKAGICQGRPAGPLASHDVGSGAGCRGEDQGNRTRRHPDQRLRWSGRGRSVCHAGLRDVPVRDQ